MSGEPSDSRTLHVANSMNTKKLILAMSPVDSVLEDLRTGSKTLWDEKCHQQEQDAFANHVESCWHEFGPSERYLKRLVQKYVSSLERSGNVVESDLLSELVFRLSLCKNTMPDANESCYLSFQLPRSCPVNEHECDANYDWLRIRVFPYHNDVALRLWEAGAALAEFFVDHPLMLRGKDIIELGAGVGLTGLAIAACCNPSSITMTDCTDICRTNLEHNLEINRRWLSKHGFSSDCINQGYLEWESFAISEFKERTEIQTSPDPTMVAFQKAQILIAADVIYDVSVIDKLVLVVKSFLTQSSQEPQEPKEAILAITKRKMSSFHLFLERVANHGICCEYLSTNCDNLPKIFFCNFPQGRKDVQIARLYFPTPDMHSPS